MYHTPPEERGFHHPSFLKKKTESIKLSLLPGPRGPGPPKRGGGGAGDPGMENDSSNDIIVKDVGGGVGLVRYMIDTGYGHTERERERRGGG